MEPIPVEGVVQHYAWGDPTFIPTLLGVAPDGRPWAELWLGTHPAGPSTLADGRTLADLAGPLPYLLKVLAAAEPLSLQAHPTAAQAVEGHARGVFGDPHPKPELLVALTPFEALCGFRSDPESAARLRSIGADALADRVVVHGAGEVMRGLYRGEIDPGPTLAALAGTDTTPWVAAMRGLADRYPGEPSVVVALLLNHVVLAPGEALHLTAGNLHAYLGGAGIELMSASDNVVRGGLTVKPVDVDLLLEIVDPTPLVDPVMEVTDDRYPLPEAGVVLVRLAEGRRWTSSGHELAVAAEGSTVYLPPGSTWTAPATAHVVTPL